MIPKQKRQAYQNMKMKQKKGILKTFNWFFKREIFDIIVEIGTGSGVFSLYIAEKAKQMGATFLTFDIVQINKDTEDRLVSLGAEFFNEDVDSTDKIENIMKSKGRVLLLNDGGLKLPQFKRYTPLLKKNDCLMTHDYYRSDKQKSRGRITLSEVVNPIQKYKLQIIYQNRFDKFLWLCCKKREK